MKYDLQPQWPLCHSSSPATKPRLEPTKVFITNTKHAAPSSRHCVALATATVDALEGRRHIETLRRWYPTALFNQLSRKAQTYRAENNDTPTSLICRAKKIKISPVSDTKVEVCLTVLSDNRIKAIAMALERVREKWIVIAFETD